MNPRLQLLVKAELERLLNATFIKPVEITDWISPMVLVKNKNGKLRVCVNYRKLNACTQKDHFPLPMLPATDATLNKLGVYTNPSTVIASVVEDIREE